MYRRKTEKEIRCPLEYGLELFGGKWKSRIICVLAQKKTLRYGELRAELANITDAVLSAALKELISDGMALRRLPLCGFAAQSRGEREGDFPRARFPFDLSAFPNLL